MTETLVNGEILVALQDKIKEALKQPRLTKKERLGYEIQQLTILYIANDHPKVAQMWPVYLVARWVLLIGGAAYITALASGKMVVTFK